MLKYHFWTLRLSAIIAAIFLLSSGCSDDSDSDANNNSGWDVSEGSDTDNTDVYDEDTHFVDAIDPQCFEYETQQRDCNSCTCDDGLWNCTQRACDTDVYDEDTNNADVSDPQCSEGETKQQDCNSCVCDDQGAWICTERACGQTYDPCEGQICGDSCHVCDPDDPDCQETDVLKFCNADGQCASETPECAVDNPCDGKTCGDTCSTCDPDDDGNCPPVMEYCDENGACNMAQPSCGS